jgi:DNA-binding NarL/FixJ family response regulator
MVNTVGFISPNVSTLRMNEAIFRTADLPKRPIPEAPKLTARQLEILHSVTRGLSNQDIAKQFGISVDGVKNHLSAIFLKLGAATRAEATAIALRKHC